MKEFQSGRFMSVETKSVLSLIDKSRSSKTFADQAVIAIENARLFQERETRNRDLAALHDVTAAASQSLEIKPVLDEVVKKITEFFDFDAVRIFLFDEARETLNAMASFGIAERASRSNGVSPRKRNSRKGGRNRRADSLRECPTDPRYQELSQSRSSQRDYCFFGIFPIKAKERFVGTISCLGKLPRRLTPEEVRLINSMCDQIGVAVENINLFEEVRNKTAELESSNAELREALEQQTATSEILRVIASSPTDLEPVLETITERAAGFAARKTRSCGWSMAMSCAWRLIWIGARCRGGARPIDRESPAWPGHDGPGNCPHR